MNNFAGAHHISFSVISASLASLANWELSVAPFEFQCLGMLQMGWTSLYHVNTGLIKYC